MHWPTPNEDVSPAGGDCGDEHSSRSSRFAGSHPGLVTLAELLEQSHWIRNLGRRWLVDENQVDDVVQQTLLSAWQSPPRDDGPLRPWLATVVRNVIRGESRLRKRRARRERRAAVAELQESTADPLEFEELQESIASALLRLQEPYRTTIVRSFFYELTTEEIAKQDDVRPNTVRVRIRRGLRLLAQHLDQRVEHREAWLLPLLFCSSGNAAVHSISTGAAMSRSPASSSANESGTRHTVEGTQPRRLASRPRVRLASALLLPLLILLLVGWRVWDAESGSRPTSLGSGDRAQQDSFTESPTSAASGGATVVSPGTANPEPLLPVLAAGTIRVLDASTGAPLEGAAVYLQPPSLRSEDLALGNTARDFLMRPFCTQLIGHSDGNGTVTVSVESLTRDRLLVQHAGYREYRERARWRSPARGYEVTLGPAAQARVHVTRAGDLPVGGASLRIRGNQGTEVHVETNSEGVGEFLWEETDYSVTVSGSGFAVVSQVASFPGTVIQLEPGRPSQGVVFSPHGPVADCLVRFRSRDFDSFPAEIRTDSWGRFETPSLPEQGSVAVEIRHPEYPTLNSTEALPWVASRDFVLAAGCFVEGEIHDPYGRPVSEGLVLLIPESGRFLGRELERAAVAPDGRFRLGPAPPGTYELCIEHPEWGNRFEELPPMAAGTLSQGPIQLSRGEAIAGQVVDPTGKPMEGVRIQVGWICGDELRGPSCETDAAGAFVLRGLWAQPPRARPANRDLRWTAALGANADQPGSAIVLEVFHPADLKNGNREPIPRYSTFGSRNTCQIELGDQNIRLEAAWAQQAPPRFDLRTPEGAPIRTLTNLVLISPTNPTQNTNVVFGETSGNSAKLRDSSALSNNLALFLTRTHTLGWVQFGSSLQESYSVPLEPLPAEGRSVELLLADGSPLGERDVFFFPVVDAPGLCGVHMGRTDQSGRLSLRVVPAGSYRFFVAQSTTSIRRRPFTTAVPVAELLDLGPRRVPSGGVALRWQVNLPDPQLEVLGRSRSR